MYLGTIPHSSEMFGVVTALSDHSTRSAVGVGVVSLVASFLDKHLTLLISDGGPDTAFSVEAYLLSEILLVMHPEQQSFCRDELLRAADLPADRVFCATKVNTPETRESLAALQPEMGLLIQFGYILAKRVLDLFPRGCINLHPSLLPFNRG